MDRDDILKLKNVTPKIAAAYIGMSQDTIRLGLQQQRCPFGFAVHMPESGRWSYHISPEALVKYKEGI